MRQAPTFDPTGGFSPELLDLGKRYQDSFQEISAAVMIVVPKTGLILCANQHGEDLTGYEAEDLCGWPLKELFVPEDQGRIINLLRGLDQQLYSENAELREHSLTVRKKSKRRVYCNLGIRRSKVNGDVSVLTLTDISAIKLQEMELRAASDYTNAILNSVYEMIFVIDAQGIIQSANTSALLNINLDFRRDQLAGQHFSRIFPGLPAEEVTYGSLPNLGVETTAVRLNQTELPVLVTSAVLQSGKPEKRQVILVANDITERKAQESKIAEQQMMLVQASKLSSLGEMASSIAHEIHNPLQIISGTSELLLLKTMDSATPKQDLSEGLAKIEQMTTRIAKTVHGLQALSRDQRHDEMEMVDLARIVSDTLELCQQKITSSVDTFEISLPTEPVLINCRPTQISQVILNLLNNSCDAVLNNRPNWIVLKAEKINEDPTSTIEISVTDSGHGIPPHIANKLFTPFYTTKPIGKGTGLGLSVSKSLIEAHKGNFYLDRSSKHTRFAFRLPLGQSPGRMIS